MIFIIFIYIIRDNILIFMVLKRMDYEWKEN